MIVRPTLGPLAKSRSFRGQPLAIILVVFALWIGLRASFWLPTMKIDEVALVPLTARSDRHHETWAGDPLGEGSVLPSRGGRCSLRHPRRHGEPACHHRHYAHGADPACFSIVLSFVFDRRDADEDSSARTLACVGRRGPTLAVES